MRCCARFNYYGVIAWIFRIEREVPQASLYMIGTSLLRVPIVEIESMT